MRFILQFAALIFVAKGQTVKDVQNENLLETTEHYITRSVDIKCFNDVNNMIYTLIPRNDIPSLELHITCNTKLDNIFRFVGNQPKASFHCLENATTITTWLGDFSRNAKSLDLSNNCIKTLGAIPFLQKLTMLKLKHNNIESIAYEVFKNFPNLEVLDLSFNSLTAFNLTYRLPSVSVLNLSYNKITSLPSELFENLPGLKELHLNGNPLSIQDENLIRGLQRANSLEVLHLGNLHLSEIPYDFFLGLNLKALYLNGNNFTAVPEELSLLGSTLLYINLNDNPIRVLNYDSFIGLNNLREIEAAGMKHLISVHEGTFSHLRLLDTVILSYNPLLSYVDPFAFRWASSSQSSIRNVYLHGNNLRHISEYLLPWSQLETLQLSGNPWACDCKLKWFLELNEKKHLNALQESGFTCAFPKWPQVTGRDVYDRPIRKFNCVQKDNYYSKLNDNSIYIGRIIVVIFVAVTFVVFFGIIFRNAYRLSQRRHVAVQDLFTLSSSVQEDFMYRKLPHNKIYSVQ